MQNAGRARVAAHYPGVRMTGSGSCLFVAFDRGEQVQAAQTVLAPLRSEGIRLLATRSGTAALRGNACSFGGQVP